MNCGNKRSPVETAESYVTEISPDGRYIRYNEILGRGAFKNVYKGFNEVDGIEIAWNQVNIEDALQSPEHLERLYYEVHLLRTLKHENVVRSYASWVDDENKTINMITELFTSASLRQYRNKHKTIDMKAIKNWARQILRGLEYLHTHIPPIIHRDLKCDNILVNGNNGEVKIGDLGLAIIMQQPTAKSVIGTPEFMAPELYDEEYNELVDIYSFGMCMLELLTCEYPYSECKNQAQIYKRVTSGIKPAALGKINDCDVTRFIEKCLVPASERPTAAELLRSSFLLSENPKGFTCDSLQLSDFILKSMNSIKSYSPFMDLDLSSKMLSGSTCAESMIENPLSNSSLELQRCNERYKFTLKGEKDGDNSIAFTLRIAEYYGRLMNVHFTFFLDADTAFSISTEMIEKLNLWKEDGGFIADLINSLISQLVPCSYGAHGKDDSERGPEMIKFPSSDIDKRDFLQADYGVEKHMGSIEQPLMSDSLRNSATSYAGSWVTASSDLGSSISSLSLTDNSNELCDDLRLELHAIDLEYQQRCRELSKMREAAIESTKKKWIMKKISVL